MNMLQIVMLPFNCLTIAQEVNLSTEQWILQCFRLNRGMSPFLVIEFICKDIKYKLLDQHGLVDQHSQHVNRLNPHRYLRTYSKN